MNDCIELRDLRVAAIVGTLPEEQLRTQPLSFDIDFVRPFETAALNDDLSGTTNYADVLRRTVQVAGEGRFLLLETLAYRVAHEVLALDEAIESVTIAVRKLRPPVPEDVKTVGVRCTLKR
jgi:dihydroneopterin aldolase